MKVCHKAHSRLGECKKGVCYFVTSVLINYILCSVYIKVVMKKITVYFLAIAMACLVPSYSENLDEIQENYDQTIGICAADGMTTGVGVSMMGWGIAIIVGISILAIVLHQSLSSTAHSSTSSKSTTGATGDSSPTLGSVL